MKNPLDWRQLLLECKTNIQAATKPCQSNPKEPQPNLGLGAGGDYTKSIDLAAETAITQTLQNHGVSFTLISEESGIKEYGQSPQLCFVCVDPVDGTTNWTHRLPFYCSSVSISDKPDLASVQAAMVVDLVHGETYTAFKNRGAYLNDQPITPSKTDSLDQAVIGLDINTYQAKPDIATFTALIENTKHTRHFGANALETCYVAAGLTDAFVDLRQKIRTTDVAAGFLVVKEAGGIVTDATNQQINVPLDPKQTLSFIASANPTIHSKILSLIKRNV